MIWRGRLPILVVTSFWLAPAAAWGVSTNPAPDERNYRVIIDRNPFGLRPPPPPPTNAPPVVVQPKDEVFLTGITSLGSPRAYFMTTVTKPPPIGKVPEYYDLGVDERKDDLEVIGIDVNAKSVRVRNAGVETVMTFESNGVKPPATPSGPVPGAPGTARPGMPPAPGTIRPPGATAQLTPGATAVTAGAGARGTGRIRTIPSRNVRAQPAPVAPAPEAQPDPDAAVQDVLIMELQRQANPEVQFPPIPIPQ